MFGHGLAIALMVGFMIGFSPVVFISSQAFADGSDDFNDNSMDPAKWRDITHKEEGSGSDKRGEWTFGVYNNWNPELLRTHLIVHGGRRFPYNSNWSIEIDVATNTSLTRNYDFSSFGINIESR